MLKLISLYAIVISIPIIGVLILALFKNWLKNYTQNQRRTEKQKLKENIHEIYVREREPLYDEAYALFNYLLKHGRLKRKDLLKIKSMLNEALGEYKKEYARMYFKNDAHEIYKKMKSENIDKTDWLKIINFLKSKQEDTLELERII